MTERTIAILGLGRSGVSASKAAVAVGSVPTVFDERPIDNPQKQAAAEELNSFGVEVRADWDGWFSPEELDFVVTSPGVPMRNPKLQAAVEEGMEVLSEVEFAYRISKAPIVAITGTNGKSTTTVMTWLCLKAAGVDAVLCGNIYGSGYPEIPLTEAAVSSTPDQILVAEISSFQLEFIKDFRPIAATITNISEDHLNRYKSFKEYADMKHRIFRNMGEGCVAVWNADDEMTRPPDGVKSLMYGLKGANGLDGSEDIESLEILGHSIRKADLPFSEPHNYRNAMCAALLAFGALSVAPFWTAARERRSSGTNEGFQTVVPESGACAPQSIESKQHFSKFQSLSMGLKSFKPLAHRMERLGEKNGISVINNSMCTNPGAVIASSQSISGPQRLLVGGENKQLGFETVRTYLETTPHTVYLFGKDAQSINQQLGSKWNVYPAMSDAFEAAAKDSRSGDTIMLAPGVASTDQFQDFRDRGEQFKKIVSEWMGK